MPISRYAASRRWSMANTALVVGATGIVGRAPAGLLAEDSWTVAGLQRNATAQDGVTPVLADLQDRSSLGALKDLRSSHVFISTWARQATEAKNIQVNRAMVRNLLDALRPAGTVRH